MPWSALQSQQYGISKVAQPGHQQLRPSALSPDAVDPALLYAKLEVLRLELESERRKRREQRRSVRDSHDAAAAKDVSQAGKALSRKPKELMRRPLPIGAECMADGKPVYNTAQILAALDIDRAGRGLTHAPVHRDDAGPKNKRFSVEPAMADSRWASQDSEEDEEPQATKRDSVVFRKPKADESVPVKLVATKHGSQTIYERVELPRPGLIEEVETSDTDEVTSSRPRLSRYDRPHWAQQSQSGHDSNLVKNIVQRARRGGSRPLSEMPRWDEHESTLTSDGSVAHAGQSGNVVHDTLIADAVHRIRREQRVRKWHSVQNFLKRASIS